MTVVPIKNSALNFTPYFASIIGKDAIKIAAAGVGNPIKEMVCLVSILNFANLIAEKMGIKKAINDIVNSFDIASGFSLVIAIN